MVWFKSTPSSKSSTWPFSELPQAPLCALVRWRGKGEEPASPRAPASPPAERRACKGLGMGLGQAREKFRFECRVSVLGGGCCAAQARNYHCAVCQPGCLGDCLRSTVPVLAEKNAVRIYHSAQAHTREHRAQSSQGAVSGYPESIQYGNRRDTRAYTILGY